jgi:predicted dehydrogenase
MAVLDAGKHLYCEWPLAATTEQAQQMRDSAVRNGVRHMVGLQARGAREFNRVRDLVAEGYVWQSAFVHDDHNDANMGNRIHA